MRTFQPKGKEIERNWHLIDAKDQILGRVATKIATFLVGKNKSTYSAQTDSGDFVVVLNAEKVKVTGKKAEQKVYRSHSGYPKGFKEVSFAKMSRENPERIIEHAVRGMVPDNRLKAQRMARLKVLVGDKNLFENKFK